VHDDGGDEQQRRPVVHLPHDEAGAHLEADVERRAVGGGHLDPAQGLERAVVDDLTARRFEEEREVHAGADQHHEAVERDLAQHERPVVGEHAVERLGREGRAAHAIVEPPQEPARQHGAPQSRSRFQKLGPTGSV
jgi:hypothetical protein